MRNKEVEAKIIEVISEWKTAEKNYTFESRIFGGVQTPNYHNGEAVMQFHIRIDGFFEDITYQKPIVLEYSSPLFITSQLSEERPDNPNADAVRLKAFLNKFTQEAYQEAEKELASYTEPYISDPIYFK